MTPVLLVDTAACLSNPCVNGGTCVEGRNLFTCICEAGFMGAICDVGTTIFFHSLTTYYVMSEYVIVHLLLQYPRVHDTTM